ncbi:MAG: hypothetical protein RRA94_10555 [Bacteroidota bacterium]|nr:hypothetical protein [Bacteroidota bacterium]
MTLRRDMAEHRMHGRRDFERSLICSLLCMVLLFAFFPVLSTTGDDTIPRSALIETADIILAPPSTAQFGAPPPARHPVPVAARTELPVLPDMSLPGDNPTRNSDSAPTAPGKGPGSGEFAFVPRQVLEVLPENGDGSCDGSVTLLLTIGWNGVPRRHRVLENGVHGENCLRYILDAVYASRWSPLPGADTLRTFTVRKRWTFR